jgi:glutathione S-transferase
MTQEPKLYGFDGSTYVRTVKMVLRDKGIDYEQEQINVLEGEPRQPEHLARHPFGKVPVLDIDGIRIREFWISTASAFARRMRSAATSRKRIRIRRWCPGPPWTGRG